MTGPDRATPPQGLFSPRPHQWPMEESNRSRTPEDRSGGVGTPGDRSSGPREGPGTPSVEVPDRGEWQSPADPAPSEAFGALASEVRVAVLVESLAAERADEDPLTFSELQEAAGVEESAGFAYHLRQLSGHFLREAGEGDGEGYVLTPAGRRAARAIVAGTFAGTPGTDGHTAS